MKPNDKIENQIRKREWHRKHPVGPKGRNWLGPWPQQVEKKVKGVSADPKTNPDDHAE